MVLGDPRSLGWTCRDIAGLPADVRIHGVTPGAAGKIVEWVATEVSGVQNGFVRKLDIPVVAVGVGVVLAPCLTLFAGYGT